MRREAIVFLVGVLFAGCAASVERECGTECAALRCDAPGELWACEVPARGYSNTFCDFAGAVEPLEDACMRSCFNAGACGVPALEDVDAYVCRCTGDGRVAE